MPMQPSVQVFERERNANAQTRLDILVRVHVVDHDLEHDVADVTRDRFPAGQTCQ